MRTRKRIVVLIVCALAAVAVALGLQSVFSAGPVEATGELLPVTQTPLDFGAVGPITEVDVRTGDIVHKGQVLARQDTTTFQAQLAADQAQLAADQAQVAFLNDPHQPAELAELQLAVDAAQAQLRADQAKASSTGAADAVAVAAAQGTLAAAQAALAAATAAATAAGPACALVATNVASAAAPASAPTTAPATTAPPTTAPPTATSTTAAAGDPSTAPSGDPSTTAPSTTAPAPTDGPPAPTQPPAPAAQGPTTTVGPVGAAECDQLRRQVAADQVDVSNDVGALQRAQAAASADAAQLQGVVSAQAAQIGVVQGSQSVGSLPSTPNVVAAAQAAVAKDQEAIAADTTAITNATLTAPSDGVVASVGGRVGENATLDGVRLYQNPSVLPPAASTGIQLFPQAPLQQSAQPPQFSSVLTLDSTQLEVVAQVAEADVHRLHRGQAATMAFPAMPGIRASGTLTDIQPQSISVSGSTYFLVDIALRPGTTRGGLDLTAATAGASSRSALPNGFLAGLTADVRL